MKNLKRQAIPLARKEGLIIKEMPDELLVYDLEDDRAHCLNQTAAFVWQRCNGRTSPREIARLLGQDMNAKIDERIVWLALDQLGRNNLLEHTPAPPPVMSGLNRREMVRALGIAAAVAIPVVTSIVAPTPAQAATCKPTGAGCAAGAECCSGVCSGSLCT